MGGWHKQAFFYSVPPVSKEFRFFNEVVENGDMIWPDWFNIRQEQSGNLAWKTMSWQPFRLAGAELVLRMRIKWNTMRPSEKTLDIIMDPLSSLSGTFRVTLAFSVWDPSNIASYASRYKSIDNYVFKKHSPIEFRNAIPLDHKMLPTVPVFDGQYRSNTALYVRIELPNHTVFPLTPARPQHVALVPGPGVVYEMANIGKETQDSTIFEYEGIRWRLFYMKKPDPMLLVQRLPADDPRTELGDATAEFDVLGVWKEKKWVKESLDHTFSPGFDDWGGGNSKFKKADYFVVRLHVTHVEPEGSAPPGVTGRYDNPPSEPAPASDPSQYGPPPGPPPGMEDRFRPPPGPPPGHQVQENAESSAPLGQQAQSNQEAQPDQAAPSDTQTEQPDNKKEQLPEYSLEK